MDYVYNIVNNVKYFYFSMNPAVLSGNYVYNFFFFKLTFRRY